MLKEATTHSCLLNQIFQTSVVFNMWQLIDCVNIVKSSEAAKLLIQLILVPNWVKQSFPCEYR